MYRVFRDGPRHGVCRGPCGLKVKSSGHAVDVEHFACKVKSGAGLAFQRLPLHRFEAHPSARDELFAERTLAVYVVAVVAQRVGQFAKPFVPQLVPFSVGDDAGLTDEVML